MVIASVRNILCQFDFLRSLGYVLAFLSVRIVFAVLVVTFELLYSSFDCCDVWTK